MFFTFLKPSVTNFIYFFIISLITGTIQQGFSQDNYTIGVGIYDITGQIAETNYFGYADPLHRNNGIRDRQYARAFIIQEPDGQPVVFVNIDKGATFQSVNLAVMEKLKVQYGDLYQDENVLISATHTHVAAGGFSHFTLYELATGGYWKTNFDNLVDGIYGAIVRAHNTMASGSIFYNKGSLTNASINRSLIAYANNADASDFSSIDDEMTVLKFVQNGTEVGMISWFGVHATNLSNTYTHNSGDNKGYASLKFERLKNSTYESSGSFVAAFANTNAGDMSPNLNLPPDNEPNQNATGPGVNEEESTDIIGFRQYEKALELYNTATTQLTGSVKIVSRYSDFSDITVASKFTDGEEQNTCIAALGVSFTAGAEDGRSGLGIKEGITKNPNIGTTIDRCHGEKPIAPLFLLGSNEEDPATPKILPTSILKIGQLGILAAPAEFTIMSGRRARATVAAVPGTGITETVFAGYVDAYAGYVTTREEYASQQYEGASTHFGPWTLGAYQQEFERLAQQLADPSVDPWPVPEPAIPFKNPPAINVTTPILYDSAPFFRNFGDIDEDVDALYAKGATAEVVFWGAHPNNDLKVNKTYLVIELQDGADWVPVYTDRDPITKLTWNRSGVSNSKITIGWKIPLDMTTGYYRIRHFGTWKQIFSGRFIEYTATSSTFFVGNEDELDQEAIKMKAITEKSQHISSDLSVYPNPTKGEVLLQLPDNFIGSYTLVDMSGKTIKAGQINEQNFIPMQTGESNGIYFLNIQQIDGKKYIFKLIKE
ncbi:ceramidase CerN [Aquimarina addita]|uniref:Neutral ceramidase n=1 Tax=Aquimarina addita TaxID=870485 RepID=A0ABP6USY0_9FLAO